MTLLVDEFKLDGARLDQKVTDRVLEARLVGRMEGAMSLELTIWDGDGWVARGDYDDKLGVYTNSLTRAPARDPKRFPEANWARFGETRLAFDGVLFRLAAVNMSGQSVRLTWDDEAAALMRRHSRRMVLSRADGTRAQAIGLGVAAVREIAIPYRCPEERIRQNIERPEDEAEGRGLAEGSRVTVKGVAADREQRWHMETVLAVADRLRAGERATLALLVACIAESTFRNLPYGDRDSRGILQVRQSTARTVQPRYVTDPRIQHGLGNPVKPIPRDATGKIAPGTLDPMDVKECARVFLLRGYWDPRDGTGMMGAIARAAKEPQAPLHQLAQRTQGSGASGGSNYSPYVNEAEAILEAWGGAGQVTVLRESFEFQLGSKLDEKDSRAENYWAAVNRLGGEVDGWHLWAWQNQVNFISDEWLFARVPKITIGPESVYPALRKRGSLAPYVEISAVTDVGMPERQVEVTAQARRWDAPPGSTVMFAGVAPFLDGRWLVREHRFDLRRDVLELTLGQPAPKGPEPAPRTRSVRRTETARQDSGSPRARILTVARRALKEKRRFYYLSGTRSRPYPGSLFSEQLPRPDQAGPFRQLGIDCSSFVTLVYRAAGIVDPNGLNYNGQGSTSTLRANGKRTSDPQPGDLAHYGSGASGPASHVAIYIGDGRIIQMGNSGVSEMPVNYGREDFAGYWTYDLSDAGVSGLG